GADPRVAARQPRRPGYQRHHRRLHHHDDPRRCARVGTTRERRRLWSVAATAAAFPRGGRNRRSRPKGTTIALAAGDPDLRAPFCRATFTWTTATMSSFDSAARGSHRGRRSRRISLVRGSSDARSFASLRMTGLATPDRPLL